MRGFRNLTMALAATAAAAVGMSATPAAATGVGVGAGGDTLTYIDFAGKCDDCSGYGLGVLTLTNYTLGTALTATNFVDFTYNSNLVPNLDLLAFNLQSITGALSDLPGTADVSISVGQAGTSDIWTLATEADGVWDLEITSFLQGDGSEFPAGDQGTANLDHGVSYTYSVAGVPEPEAWTLMIAGFGVAGGALRRRRQQVGAAL